MEIYEEDNKRGWVRIVEAFVAILLIAGVLILVISEMQSETINSSDAQEIEKYILKDVQLNESLREDIVGVEDSSLPLLWADFESAGLEEVRLNILGRISGNVNCVANICALDDDCGLGIEVEKNREVYALSKVVSATSDNYSPKQVKIFCWEI